jgi:isoaspartyl peptidase/L-asparaginase-like protein (Ntn-hydrolase superfamily)
MDFRSPCHLKKHVSNTGVIISSNKQSVYNTIMKFGILLHGGAGSNKRKIRNKAYTEQEEEIRKTIGQAACSGFDVLNHDYNPLVKRNNNNNSTCAAVDAVELAVAIMEDGGVFNAGVIGSCLTSDGQWKWMLQ